MSLRARTALFFCFCIAGLLASSPAPAQAQATAGAPIAAVSPATAREVGPRVRFGFGGEAGGLGAPEYGLAGFGALGLYARFGVQVNDFLGVHVTGAGSSLLLSNYARGALVIDVSPVRFFSIGTGFMAAGTYFISPGNSPSEGSSTFVGVPLAFSLFTKGDESGARARRGTGFTLTFAAGYAEIEQQYHSGYKGFGIGATLSIGYERR